MTLDVDARAAELVSFALSTLPAMRLEDGVFCHEVVAPGERASGGRLGRGARAPAGAGPSRLGRSLRYTLMVLIGALRARDAGLALPFDPGELWPPALAELRSARLTVGDLGLALWADARCGLESADRIAAALDERLSKTDVDDLEGHELSWIATGCAHAVAAGKDEPRVQRWLERSSELLIARARTPSGLLCQYESGLRARFPHFATQVYGVLALVAVARARDDERPAAVAVKVADRLLELQLADGAWPWIYDAQRGTVIEPYRLYSVHQDAMAPMALQALSELTGEARFARSALRGLPWVWGANELATPMLDRGEDMLYRSINRRGWRDRAMLWGNTIAARVAGPLRARQGGPTEVERTDRPYHLGWVLEAWADRVAALRA